MDKKNTILLTVIAVATLLVAVVGATFAYYSVQVSNDKTKVNVNASAGAIGVLTLSTPTDHLYMNVTPTDMANYGENKSYYATDQSNNDLTISNKNDKQTDYVVSKLTVSEGNPNSSYTCKAKLQITLQTDTDSMGKVLQSGDVKLHLTGDNVKKDNEETGLNETLDLYEIVSIEPENENTKVKEYNIIYKVNGNNQNAEIKAALELINKKKGETEDGNQSYLAGKTLDVTIQVVSEGDKLDCSIDAAPAE